jgi:hypothetical protein
LIAADIVEVAPAYDTNAELTTMAAAVSAIVAHISAKNMLTLVSGHLVRSNDFDGHEGTSQRNGLRQEGNYRAIVCPRRGNTAEQVNMSQGLPANWVYWRGREGRPNDYDSTAMRMESKHRASYGYIP